MVSETEEILSTLSENDVKYIDIAKNGFETHWFPTRNVTYERYKLYTKTQDEGESPEQFITWLYTLVQTWEFSTFFQEEMIRDRIVCGSRDKKFSEDLQLNTKFTLEKSITISRRDKTI